MESSNGVDLAREIVEPAYREQLARCEPNSDVEAQFIVGSLDRIGPNGGVRLGSALGFCDEKPAASSNGGFFEKHGCSKRRRDMSPASAGSMSLLGVEMSAQSPTDDTRLCARKIYGSILHGSNYFEDGQS